jgi:hypothetical protein
MDGDLARCIIGGIREPDTDAAVVVGERFEGLGEGGGGGGLGWTFKADADGFGGAAGCGIEDVAGDGVFAGGGHVGQEFSSCEDF